MFWPGQCAAVIPCRNESATLSSVLLGLRPWVNTIVVVDDGSTDDTALMARTAGAICLRFERNGGKGAALQAGFRAVRERGFRHVLTLDGDGQHLPSDVPKFFACAKRGAHLVIGNRTARRGQMPLVRRAVNRLMSAGLSLYTDCALPDSQCGFRLIDLSCLPEREFSTRHFEFESELLVFMAHRGCRIEFVPIQTIYGGERSKIRPLPDTWRWLRWAAHHA
ncbi:MAG TPA: glycosyltransferase family 2 protein [Candidatus Saccharimonadales bacterium]|nr:glycosyltransferase family 2 protein [Candidatus Saccharimonadales bacterium]